jgi:HTH-type transcriptional regulator/antitoxin HipB
MDDLDRYLVRRKKIDPQFAREYGAGYEKFKVGVLLRQAREHAGLTQEELARRLRTKKSAISRMERHAEDIKVSTLERVALALGKRLRINLG